MANSNSYGLGKQLGQLVKITPWWGKLIVGLILLKIMYSFFSSPTEEAAALDTAPVIQVVDEKKICQDELPQKLQAYNDLLSKKVYWEAATAIRACSLVLSAEKPELAKMVADAEIEYYLSSINSKEAPEVRARAMASLLVDYPEVGAKYEKEMNVILASERKKSEAAEKKLKKSQGVNIGMTPDDVYASSWGRPKDVNRTTTVRGVREQWVYDGGYLYFENGILTSIQN